MRSIKKMKQKHAPKEPKVSLLAGVSILATVFTGLLAYFYIGNIAILFMGIVAAILAFAMDFAVVFLAVKRRKVRIFDTIIVAVSLVVVTPLFFSSMHSVAQGFTVQDDLFSSISKIDSTCSSGHEHGWLVSSSNDGRTVRLTMRTSGPQVVRERSALPDLGISTVQCVYDALSVPWSIREKIDDSLFSFAGASKQYKATYTLGFSNYSVFVVVNDLASTNEGASALFTISTD